MATRRRPATAVEIPLDIDAARAQARDCTACDLYKFATQTVFGEGPRDAHVEHLHHTLFAWKLPLDEALQIRLRQRHGAWA